MLEMRALAVCAILLGCTQPSETIAKRQQPVHTVCADGPVIEGIDVSHHQGTVDWPTVATTDVTFAYIRVSDGLNVHDRQFESNWLNVTVTRGAYQFFRPDQDPIAQAELLVDAVGTLEQGDLPPALDLEVDGVTPEQILDWLDVVEAELGLPAVIYASPAFWDTHLPDGFEQYPLWTAHYGPDCPWVPDPWPRWTFWQYTGSGRVDGVATIVDRNVFNGGVDALRALTVQPSPVLRPEAGALPPPRIDPESTCAVRTSGQFWLVILLALAIVRKKCEK